MSVHLGKYIDKDIDVDHKDEDKTNDVIENLQLLSHTENNRKQVQWYRDTIQVKHKLICANLKCNKEYELIDRHYKSRKKNGVKNFCCSKRCSSIVAAINRNNLFCKTTDAKIINQILELKSKDRNTSEISEKLKVSKATVNRYWLKYRPNKNSILKKKAVSSYNLLAREELIIPSIKDCVRRFKLVEKTFKRYLNKNLQDKYRYTDWVFKYADRPWKHLYTNKLTDASHLNKDNRAVIVNDSSTSTITVFSTIEEASEFLNKNSITIPKDFKDMLLSEKQVQLNQVVVQFR